MDASSIAHNPRRLNIAAALAICFIAAAFAFHAWAVARTKSPTYDEPAHTFSSWLIVNDGDFRLSPEHPALWRYIPGLALLGQPLVVDFFDPSAVGLFQKANLQWSWSAKVMSQTPGNDGVHLVRRARGMMTLFPFALALIVGRWAWAWGGRMCGIFAAALIVFDPNLLAHAGLVTNDVPATLIFTAAAYLTWRLGERFSWQTATLLALTCAAGIATKMNCLLLAPIIAIALLYRSLERRPWKIGAHDLTGRPWRLLIVIGYGVAVASLSLALLWPIYQFRYAPTPRGGQFSDERMRVLHHYFELVEENGRPRTDEAYSALLKRAESAKTDLSDRIIYALTDSHLVPHAWGFGYTYTRANSVYRTSYLMGELSNFGFISYFPIAIACKTPITTLALAVAGGMATLLRVHGILDDPRRRWKAICLVLPPAIYLGVAMGSNLDIGLRHILPIYPPVYVGIAVMLTATFRRVAAPMLRVAIPSLAVVVLAAETLSVAPDYISFFNRAVGGKKGGMALLADSNLDWGQDLNALAAWYRPWRAAHPNRPFYLSYFGSIDPSAYGIDWVNAVPGYDFSRTPPTADLAGGTYAISATMLQGVVSGDIQPIMARLRNTKPTAIVGNTIYLYDPAPADLVPTDRKNPATTSSASIASSPYTQPARSTTP